MLVGAPPTVVTVPPYIDKGATVIGVTAFTLAMFTGAIVVTGAAAPREMEVPGSLMVVTVPRGIGL
jgi:hypothetical protein